MTPRSRAFCFTLNNYTDQEQKDIQEIPCRYIIYGREKGEVEATPHLQGYLYFENARSLTAVSKLIPRGHIEVARGDATSNYNYCTKDNDYFEAGEKPNNMLPTTYDECRTYSQVLLLKFQIGQRIDARSEPPTIYWFYGRTGTGKTRRAYAMGEPGDIYIKNPSKWWDHYVGQSTVILDDFARPANEELFRAFLQLTDRYPHLIETKGGVVNFNSPLIIVTCEFSPRDLWTGNQCDQVTRRIKKIYKCLLLDNVDATSP